MKERITLFISPTLIRMMAMYDTEYRRIFGKTSGSYSDLMIRSGAYDSLTRFLDTEIDLMKGMPSKATKRGRPRKQPLTQ